MKEKKNIANLLLILGILWFVFGCSTSGNDANPTKQKPNDSAPANISLHAAELVRAFEENEVRANQLYRDKRVRIHGTVNRVEINNSGGFILTFKTSVSTYSPAQCYFSEAYSNQIAQIRSNEEATVEGTVRGFRDSKFSVVLDNCSIP